MAEEEFFSIGDKIIFQYGANKKQYVVKIKEILYNYANSMWLKLEEEEDDEYYTLSGWVRVGSIHYVKFIKG